MTDEATPKKITRKRPTLYPVQLVVMISEDQAEAIEADRAERKRNHVPSSKAAVVRDALDYYFD